MLAVFPSAPAYAEPPGALPSSVEGDDARWQPALDSDTDSCYSTPAIDSAGKVAEGLEPTGDIVADCRDEADLRNTNTYVRSKSNNGWTAYLYDSYFEKDQSVDGSASGHRHDIEHVVVWVSDGRAKFVSTSAHGSYTTKAADEVPWEGDHPKIVYHKDGGSTHAFRHATANDEPPENHDGTWQLPAVVSWNKFPEGVRETLLSADFGAAQLGIKDTDRDGKDKFTKELDKAEPDGIPFDPYA
ncbi:hypothetical protein CFN78_21175 [Amycolatopsis antarctica]|uniref:Necrosis inducing protein (NPP1) n=2 Tax=Amycolatopsis antarctica TaxID=1854586 RepID=A0A263CYV7_9PSEU|nr:hypothetical protein CFN78_21175 [Amycolatopsis antarctica]